MYSIRKKLYLLDSPKSVEWVATHKCNYSCDHCETNGGKSLKDELNISCRDALKVAIDKEDIAFRLYADMAANAEDEQSRNMLYELAEEEERHKQKCQAQYNTLIEWGG